MKDRKPILFIGDAVSLAHIARPLSLAQALDPEEYDIHVACDERYRAIAGVGKGWTYWPIQSASGKKFIAAANRGSSFYTARHLESYIREELVLLRTIRPFLIVQDLRFSISVSAELLAIPYATVTNLYWSPYLLEKLNWAPLKPSLWSELAQKASEFEGRVRRKLGLGEKPPKDEPINAVRKKHGLKPLPRPEDLYAQGDFTLYLDPPGILQTSPLPAHHRVLGAALWSPDAPLPSWWRNWNKEAPLVYVTVGTTGAARWLEAIIAVLAALDVVVIVATADRFRFEREYQNVHDARYLPGVEACGLASLVICNGGSATSYQALSQGKPVIGIWSNTDQYRNMQVLEKAGAGTGYRASRFDPGTFRNLVLSVLRDKRYAESARTMQVAFDATDARQNFRDFVRQVEAGTLVSARD